MPQPYEHAYAWGYTNRIYENHLFFRLCIIAFWFFVAQFYLGFEIDGFNKYQDLMANFGVFLLLCAILIISLLIFYRIYEKPKGEKYLKQLEYKIENNLKPNEQEWVWDYLETSGYLLPDHKQRNSLILLSILFLFELFLLSAWIKEGYLVWQPTWILVIINWVENRTTWEALIHYDKWLAFTAMFDHKDLVYKYHKTPQEFLSSELGKASMFYSFYKLITFIPTLWLLNNTFGEMVGWLGLNRIKHRMQNGFLGFLFGGTAMLVGLLFCLTMYLMFVISLASNDKIQALLNGSEIWWGIVLLQLWLGNFSLFGIILFKHWLITLYHFFYNTANAIFKFDTDDNSD